MSTNSAAAIEASAWKVLIGVMVFFVVLMILGAVLLSRCMPTTRRPPTTDRAAPPAVWTLPLRRRRRRGPVLPAAGAASAGGVLAAPLVAQVPLELDRQLVAGGHAADVERVPLGAVEVGLELAHQRQVLVALVDELVDLLQRGVRFGVQGALSNCRPLTVPSPSTSAALAAGTTCRPRSAGPAPTGRRPVCRQRRRRAPAPQTPGGTSARLHDAHGPRERGRLLGRGGRQPHGSATWAGRRKAPSPTTMRSRAATPAPPPTTRTPASGSPAPAHQKADVAAGQVGAAAQLDGRPHQPFVTPSTMWPWAAGPAGR